MQDSTMNLFVSRYLQHDLDMFDLDDLECKFDVVYIDPPLEEYQRRASGTTFNWKPWTWDEVSCGISVCFSLMKKLAVQSNLS